MRHVVLADPVRENHIHGRLREVSQLKESEQYSCLVCLIMAKKKTKKAKSVRKDSENKNIRVSGKAKSSKWYDSKKINNFLFGHEELLWQDYAAMGFLGFLIVLFLYSYLKFINVI